MSTSCGHHSHSGPAPTQLTWRLGGTLGLVTLYFLAELIGGFWTGSLSLLADAAHMFSDMAALALSLFAAHMATRKPTVQQTFGHLRAEILAALANGALLFVVAGGVIHEAYERFSSPQPILAGPMLGIALGGLAVNLLSMAVLHGGREHNLNLQGAWLHALGDALGSIGVIAAAALIWIFGWTWADPLASVLVCLLILYSAWQLVADAVRILMEYAPRDIDVEHVKKQLLSVDHVAEIHCLHVWTIASGLRAMSAHIVATSDRVELTQLQSVLRKQFSLDHITLQVEVQGVSTCQEQLVADCLLGPTLRHVH
ncbi:cation diffusion facilitator family transporter [Planctomicrobium sp. SH664]|uniref:cation diffusion facilitator family transporter n=1 Tax=Planctomicrobium sp. SH664 TaxID=3448125 RepID=UPI003F5BEB99